MRGPGGFRIVVKNPKMFLRPVNQPRANLPTPTASLVSSSGHSYVFGWSESLAAITRPSCQMDCEIRSPFFRRDQPQGCPVGRHLVGRLDRHLPIHALLALSQWASAFRLRFKTSFAPPGKA